MCDVHGVVSPPVSAGENSSDWKTMVVTVSCLGGGGGPVGSSTWWPVVVVVGAGHASNCNRTRRTQSRQAARLGTAAHNSSEDGGPFLLEKKNESLLFYVKHTTQARVGRAIFSQRQLRRRKAIALTGMTMVWCSWISLGSIWLLAAAALAQSSDLAPVSSSSDNDLVLSDSVITTYSGLPLGTPQQDDLEELLSSSTLSPTPPPTPIVEESRASAPLPLQNLSCREATATAAVLPTPALTRCVEWRPEDTQTLCIRFLEFRRLLVTDEDDHGIAKNNIFNSRELARRVFLCLLASVVILLVVAVAVPRRQRRQRDTKTQRRLRMHPQRSVVVVSGAQW